VTPWNAQRLEDPLSQLVVILVRITQGGESAKEARMYDREQMKVAVGQLSWKKILDVLAADALASTEAYDRLVEDVVRTGCLIKKHATDEQRKARDAFRTNFREFIVEKSTTDLVNYLDAHLLECERIERAFDTILSSLAECDVSKRSIQEQVWAVIERTVAEIELIHQKLGEFVVKSPTANGFAFMNPLNVKIKNEQGELVNPDALVNTLIEAMGSSIKLLAYQGRLLDGKRIVLPPYTSVDETMQTEAIVYHLYARAWELVEEGSEHVRYWGEEIVLEDNGIPPGNEGRQEFMRFDMDLSTEMFFRIARVRLDQQFLQNSMKLQRLAQLDLLDPRHEKVSFVANTFVSIEEADAYLSLSSVYNYPASSSSKSYGGLTFREWIRAYAVLERCYARDGSGNHRMELIPIDKTELKNTLARASLTPEKAEAFIASLIFSLEKLDVYDAPLLEDSYGHLYFFAPAYAAVSLPKVILSQFNSQGIQVLGKGELFEDEVRRMFHAAKIQAVGFKYWVGDQEFDCDAAVLWNDQLFIFECKNYGLPTGRASDDFYFIKKLEEAGDQLRRIGRQLAEDPSILKKQLGASAHWSGTHLVVLNAMPVCSAGEINGVYFYDASALGKLLREKQISILIDPSGSQGDTKSVATLALWDGNVPQAKDLLKQLNDPIQLKLVQGKLTTDWTYVRLSSQLLIGIPFVKSEPITPEEMLEALGHTSDSATSILKDVKNRMERNGDN
jgi:hypothetical protein